MTLQAKWSSCDVTMKKYCMQGVCGVDSTPFSGNAPFPGCRIPNSLSVTESLQCCATKAAEVLFKHAGAK